VTAAVRRREQKPKRTAATAQNTPFCSLWGVARRRPTNSFYLGGGVARPTSFNCFSHAPPQALIAFLTRRHKL